MSGEGAAAVMGRVPVKGVVVPLALGCVATLGRWSRRTLPALALSVAALLALSAGVARAEVPTLLPDGQLESAGALGVAVDNSCSLHAPPLTGSACTAFDQSSGDVYVGGYPYTPKEGEFDYGRVNKFDALGNLLEPPLPFGEGFGYSGTAVNPTNGYVYALKAYPSEIDTYDPTTGEPVGPPFSVPPSDDFSFFGERVITVVGIATDAAGNVYVPVALENKVLEYDPATCPAAPEPCVPLKTFTGGSGAGALNAPTGVAVDAAGNLWVADTGNNRIEELNPSGAPVEVNGKPVEIQSEGVGSIAVDAHGDVFAIVSNGADPCEKIEPPCSHLLEYSPTGAQLADLGAGSIGAAQFTAAGDREAVPDMVAVSDATGLVYVTEAVTTPPLGGSAGRVFEFRPPVAPKLEGETAAEVGVSAAKLGAVVNPGGLSAAYRFEYDTREYKEGEGPHGSTVPSPEGDAGAGFTARTVWAGASGLAPGTTYHYRVVVTGALGEPLVGKDQTFTTEAAAQAACPNEQFRTGFSAALPDCRAYELVTPPNKASAEPDKDVGGNGPGELKVGETLRNNYAAVDGNRLSFNARDVLPGSPSGGQAYVATRGSGGWSEENMFPPTNSYGFECADEGSPNGGKLDIHGFSEDLSRVIISVPGGGACGTEPELVSGEPRGGSLNLFVRDNETGTYQLLNGPEAGVAGFVPETPTLLGKSSDFSRIVFAEEAQLTSDAPAGVDDVYEWSAGHVHLATVLANGTSVAGSFLGISKDGSRVFFTAAGGLYARVDGTETVQLDASQAGGAGGGGSFQSASQDGSVVFFTDEASAGLTSDTQSGSGTNLYRYDASAPPGQRLTDLTPVSNGVTPAVSGVSQDGSVVFFTDDGSAKLTSDTVPGSGKNLYRYDATAPAGERLTDLTPATLTGHAEVEGVLGVSEEGCDVASVKECDAYFMAKGELTSQPNQHGETAQGGQPNMYVSRCAQPVNCSVAAAPTFIVGNPGSFRLSANGAFLAFESASKLTPYDNVNPSTGRQTVELYLYDAVANSLACASCNPSGEPPTAAGGAGFGGGEGVEERTARNLSENGQLFFDTAEGLLPADTNGIGGCSQASGAPACDDVYEFEPAGVGSCSEPAGCLYLISTGTGTSETFFVDASPSGNDVFIREFQKLVPSDSQDGAPSLYDVRVDGGLPEPPPPPPCTTADACRTAPAPQPAIFGAPASQTFSGLGNLAPGGGALNPVVRKVTKNAVKCKKGFVKNKKGKCVKKSKKKKTKAKKSNRKGSK